MKILDVVIIGGGVTGTALLYVLSKYTNIKNIALIEKYDELAHVNSHPNNNSQTLHFGDIETNYTLEKAREVKVAADMVKNYVLKNDPQKKTYSKYHKMVLAVGGKQVLELKKRHKSFKKLFSNILWLGKEDIKELEPKVISGRSIDEEIGALFSPDGYTMDYQGLSKSFVENSKNSKVFLKRKVEEIRKTEEGYEINFEGGKILSKVVIVATGAHSLFFAKNLGYGKDISLFCIAGSFYFVPKSLNGKVYTIQKKKLPFAAIHGDPDVHESETTRFGPTAKAIPLLERHQYKTFFEFLKTTGLGIRTIRSFLNINSDKIILGYVIKNLFYDLPFIGKRLFLKEVRKIVPETKLSELKYAKGYGGVRPQIVNLKTKSLDMGEAKIVGDKIIFNITPSPGASTCLKNAEADTKKIIEFLENKYKFDEEKFERDFKI